MRQHKFEKFFLFVQVSPKNNFHVTLWPIILYTVCSKTECNHFDALKNGIVCVIKETAPNI